MTFGEKTVQGRNLFAEIQYSVFNLEIIVKLVGQLRLYGHKPLIIRMSNVHYGFEVIVAVITVDHVNSMGGRDLRKRRNATYIFSFYQQYHLYFAIMIFLLIIFLMFFYIALLFFGFRLFCLGITFFFLRYYNLKLIFFSVQCVKSSCPFVI